MLQHNVPSLDEAKRTPSACQTCRRRKTKCDSAQPCSACVDLGEPCVRESSGTQALSSGTRDSSYSGAVTVVESGTIVSSSIPNSGSNSLSTTSMNLDPMQLLTEETIEMPPGTSLPTSGTDSSAYCENVPSVKALPFELPLPLSTETGGHLPSDLLTEMQMVDSTTFAPPSQAQLITAQIKSAEFKQFHQAWPLLHVPTFKAETTSTLLTSALMWMQNANRHHLLLDEISQKLTRALIVRTVSTSRNW